MRMRHRIKKWWRELPIISQITYMWFVLSGLAAFVLPDPEMVEAARFVAGWSFTVAAFSASAYRNGRMDGMAEYASRDLQKIASQYRISTDGGWVHVGHPPVTEPKTDE